MKILFLGDCHGRIDLVRDVCIAAKREHGVEAAIQVGDFGFFPTVFARYFGPGSAPFPIPLHVIDGNHEDHDWLAQCLRNGAASAWKNLGLHVQGRGTVADIGGLRVGFLGGALHADRRQEWSNQWKSDATESRSRRRPPVPRDPVWANWVTMGDVKRASVVFAQRRLDLVVTHSCPAGIGVGMVGNIDLVGEVERFIERAGHYSGPFDDCGEVGLTILWNQLAQRPPLWVFGHFHRIRDRMVDGTRFVCVGSTDGSDGAATPRLLIFDASERRFVRGPELYERYL